MFVRQPQFRNASADVQIFYGDADAATSTLYRKSWNKPPGVSNVYMLLIGAGGNGNGTNGGGSGAVTVWYGAAQNVPDSLLVQAARSGVQTATEVYYRGSDLTTLLSANSGSGSAGGAAVSATSYPFAASGFYQSIAGQNGSPGTILASATTFLSGGGSSGVPGNYGYINSNVKAGFFMLQPIIVGTGGSAAFPGGIGCGGGVTGLGGQGMVLIASW